MCSGFASNPQIHCNHLKTALSPPTLPACYRLLQIYLPLPPHSSPHISLPLTLTYEPQQLQLKHLQSFLQLTDLSRIISSFLNLTLDICSIIIYSILSSFISSSNSSSTLTIVMRYLEQFTSYTSLSLNLTIYHPW